MEVTVISATEVLVVPHTGISVTNRIGENSTCLLLLDKYSVTIRVLSCK
jgi:hypothetical protein